jgi:hypothetical protein
VKGGKLRCGVAISLDAEKQSSTTSHVTCTNPNAQTASAYKEIPPAPPPVTVSAFLSDPKRAHTLLGCGGTEPFHRGGFRLGQLLIRPVLQLEQPTLEYNKNSGFA